MSKEPKDEGVRVWVVRSPKEPVFPRPWDFIVYYQSQKSAEKRAAELGARYEVRTKFVRKRELEDERVILVPENQADTGCSSESEKAARCLSSDHRSADKAQAVAARPMTHGEHVEVGRASFELQDRHGRNAYVFAAKLADKALVDGDAERAQFWKWVELSLRPRSAVINSN
jgi:hypothetical protein